jgi:hypothetical protein
VRQSLRGWEARDPDHGHSRKGVEDLFRSTQIVRDLKNNLRALLAMSALLLPAICGKIPQRYDGTKKPR